MIYRNGHHQKSHFGVVRGSVVGVPLNISISSCSIGFINYNEYNTQLLIILV